MWSWTKIAVFSVPFLLALCGAAAWMLFRKTIRTRHRMNHQLRHDPDIDEWMVTFNWSRKILYLPTILTSVVACALMFLRDMNVMPQQGEPIVGGIWLGVFFLNFLVDEYEISIKVLMIMILCILVLFLWLGLLGWTGAFLRLFKHLGVRIDWTGYLILAVIFGIAIFVSWFRGLFYYVAITPNYMNVQIGLTETGEQISYQHYNTRVDTGDFLERLFGFGRIIITFNDLRREPLVLLVSRVGKVAARLESIRGKLAVDRRQNSPAPPPPSPS